MWLLSYITKNSHEPPNAVKGNVYENGTAVTASGEHKSLRACLPYGIVSIPPKNECAVVLPLEVRRRFAARGRRGFAWGLGGYRRSAGGRAYAELRRRSEHSS